MSDAFDLLEGLVLEDGRLWGLAATDWQKADARAVLDLDGPRQHFQTRPRGGSKTTDAAAVGIAALVEQLPPQSRSYAVAADKDQGGLLIDSAAGFVARTPGLDGLLKVEAYRVVHRVTGASLEVLAADEASSWGLRPHLVIVDELAQWKGSVGPRRLFTSLFSALPKTPSSRLLIITSSGDPGHWSRQILDAAVSRPERWRVAEQPGPLPWLSEEDLAEQRATLTSTDYARLHLNEWTAPEDRLTSRSDVEACVGHRGDLAPEDQFRYCAGLDLGLRNDRTVLTICHLAEDRQTVVVDRQHVWAGSKAAEVVLGEVEATAAEAARLYRCPVYLDPWNGAQLRQNLRRRGVKVEDFTFSQQAIGRLAVTLYRLLANRHLDLPDDPDLVDELSTVKLVERSPGVWRLDHDEGRHDDRAISLALAAYHLVSRPAKRMVRSAGWLGGPG